MRHTTATLLALSLLSATPCVAKPDSDGWFRNLGEAQRVARDTGRPMFIVFRCET
ncbi:MAG: hypothetical protein VB859_19595 [Planctomycetaceae bacterium]